MNHYTRIARNTKSAKITRCVLLNCLNIVWDNCFSLFVFYLFLVITIMLFEMPEGDSNVSAYWVQINLWNLTQITQIKVFYWILSLPRYQLQHRPMTLLTTELPVDDTSNDSEISVRAFRYIQVKVAGWRVEFHIYHFHVHHGFNQVKQAGWREGLRCNMGYVICLNDESDGFLVFHFHICGK